MNLLKPALVGALIAAGAMLTGIGGMGLIFAAAPLIACVAHDVHPVLLSGGAFVLGVLTFVAVIHLSDREAG